MSRPVRINWAKVKEAYRKNAGTVVQLAVQFNCSDAAIHRMAKRFGWKKNLAPHIKKEIKKKLRKKAKAKKKRGRYTVSDPIVTPERDAEIVEAAADRGVMVVQAHRGDMMQLRMLIGNMAQELAILCQNPMDLARAINMVTSDNSDGLTNRELEVARNKLLRTLDLNNRTASVRNLAKALATLVPLERQAFGLDDTSAPPEDDYTSMEDRVRKYSKALEHRVGPPELKIVNTEKAND